MKLHYSIQGVGNSRYRKIRAVIKAAGLEVQDVPHQPNADLSKLTVFKTLPILQTNQGSIFSSNSIVRYLATIGGNKLYGGENLHHRAQVDQWLDVSSCQFDAAVSAVIVAKDGKDVDVTSLSADIHKILGVIEKSLQGKKFFVGQSLSIADIAWSANLGVVFQFMLGEQQRKKYPNLTNWYENIISFDGSLGSKDLPKQCHKAFKPKEQKKEQPKGGKGGKQKKKQQKKEDKKEEKKEQGDDLFDDDGDSKPAAAPVKKPQPPKKAKKEVIAKSIVVFQVKVYQQQEDLDKLAAKILALEIDGLVWNKQPKKIPVVGKIFKLQIGCVIEDAKVLTDDIFEKIQQWQEVQSTDMISMQKL